MKKGRFLWSAHRITERQKAGKARSIKGKQLKNSRSTVWRLLVAHLSSASDNLQLKNAKKARKYAIFRAFSMPKILSGLFGFDGIWTEIYGFIVVKLLVDNRSKSRAWVFPRIVLEWKKDFSPMKALILWFIGCILNDNALRFIHQEEDIWTQKQQAALLQNSESKRGTHKRNWLKKSW